MPDLDHRIETLLTWAADAIRVESRTYVANVIEVGLTQGGES